MRRGRATAEGRGERLVLLLIDQPLPFGTQRIGPLRKAGALRLGVTADLLYGMDAHAAFATRRCCGEIGVRELLAARMPRRGKQPDSGAGGHPRPNPAWIGDSG